MRSSALIASAANIFHHGAMVRRKITLFEFAVVVCCFTNQVVASAHRAPDEPLSDEYERIVLIYDSELTALGNRALFPICIDTSTGIRKNALAQYLRRAGLEVSDTVVCEPATASGGRHRPKGYPHGLRISVDRSQSDSEGLISVHVVSGDLTLRPGQHFALILRQGTYYFKRDESRMWQITGYTKEYDSLDEKGKDGCDSAPASTTKE